MNLEIYFKKLTAGENLSVPDRLLVQLLRLISCFYGLVMVVRSLLFRVGIFRSYGLPRPVISVGNIVVGGTGKTPMTLWLARHFLSNGKKVVVLTRGYGGRLEGKVAVVADGESILLSAADAGDEPVLLATLLPGLIVVMGSNRFEAGRLAMESFNPDLFILDDGFQHLRLRRNLNILLLDGEKPLGNGWVFPAGTLREPVSAAKRADLAVHTRCSEAMRPPNAGGEHTLQVRAFHKLTGFQIAGQGEVHSFGELAGKRGLAFAGIADPDRFFDGLEATGLSLAATLSFPDHTGYGEEEIAALARLRLSSRADYLITTAKDGVKLGSSGEQPLPFYIANLEIGFYEESVIRAELDKLL